MVPNYIAKTENAFPTLTRGLKKVADYLLNDSVTFAIHPAKEIGTIIGVSETMIIRFCNAIGYEGFSELQDEIRRHMMDLNQHSIYDSEGKDNHSNNFLQSVEQDVNLLQNYQSKLDAKELDAIVSEMIQSEKVIIVGYHQSFAFAYWLYYNLTYILKTGHLYRPESDFMLLETAPKNSCVVVFSFYRYAMDTIRFVKDAETKGLKIIVITDSRVSPIVEFADYTILINLKNASMLRRGPVTLSVLSSVIHELISKVDKTSMKPPTYKYFIKDGEKNYD